MMIEFIIAKKKIKAATANTALKKYLLSLPFEEVKKQEKEKIAVQNSKSNVIKIIQLISVKKLSKRSKTPFRIKVKNWSTKRPRTAKTVKKTVKKPKTVKTQERQNPKQTTVSSVTRITPKPTLEKITNLNQPSARQKIKLPFGFKPVPKKKISEKAPPKKKISEKAPPKKKINEKALPKRITDDKELFRVRYTPPASIVGRTPQTTALPIEQAKEVEERKISRMITQAINSKTDDNTSLTQLIANFPHDEIIDALHLKKRGENIRANKQRRKLQNFTPADVARQKKLEGEILNSFFNSSGQIPVEQLMNLQDQISNTPSSSTLNNQIASSGDDATEQSTSSTTDQGTRRSERIANKNSGK
jgi:hypothetical protein